MARRLLATVLGLSLFSAGCQRLAGFTPPEHLQIVLAYGDGSDAVSRTSLERLAGQMAQEFMRNNPGSFLHLRFLPEADLLVHLREKARLGAAPDLLVARVPAVAKLAGEGLVRPSALGPEQLDPLRLQFLSRFREGPSYKAIPFLLQPSLACYNRSRVPRPPRRLEDLPRLAAAGVRVGLPLEIDELLWTASGFAADKPLLDALELSPQPLTALDRARVVTWLTWLDERLILDVDSPEDYQRVLGIDYEDCDG